MVKGEEAVVGWKKLGLALLAVVVVVVGVAGGGEVLSRGSVVLSLEVELEEVEEVELEEEDQESKALVAEVLEEADWRLLLASRGLVRPEMRIRLVGIRKGVCVLAFRYYYSINRIDMCRISLTLTFSFMHMCMMTLSANIF